MMEKKEVADVVNMMEMMIRKEDVAEEAANSPRILKNPTHHSEKSGF